ncbi:DUF1501 domain-containing protein [Pseudoroseomonas cervicalis]|uniref:DUF1501 domain-containing protein n=1 Tax=Teichococcus cervicalis TaxID=204525 RepID=UPI0035EEE4C1
MTLFRPHQPRIGRRGLLLGLTALAALGQARLAVASPASTAGRGEARLVVVLLRGALDGLAVVQPYGDAALRELRGPLALPEPGQEGGLLELGGFFGLHPSMDKVHALYQRNEALVLHAVAGPYRTRSHFDAQDLMESGAESRLSSGWLNRALQAMAPDPAQGARAGLALGYDLPLLLRGPRPVSVYTPQRGEAPPAELYARLADLAHDDPLLGPAVQEGAARARLCQRRAGPGSRPQRLPRAGGDRRASAGRGGWSPHRRAGAGRLGYAFLPVQPAEGPAGPAR